MKVARWLAYLCGYVVLAITVPILAVLVFGPLMCWDEPVAGSVSAVIVVAYTYYAAPGYKTYFMWGGYVLGMYLAYQQPELRWYPECHDKAYMPTWVPLMATYVAGLLTALLISLRAARSE